MKGNAKIVAGEMSKVDGSRGMNQRQEQTRIEVGAGLALFGRTNETSGAERRMWDN